MTIRPVRSRLRPVALGVALALSLPFLGHAVSATAVSPPAVSSSSDRDGSVRSIDGRYLVT